MYDKTFELFSAQKTCGTISFQILKHCNLYNTLHKNIRQLDGGCWKVVVESISSPILLDFKTPECKLQEQELPSGAPVAKQYLFAEFGVISIFSTNIPADGSSQQSPMLVTITSAAENVSKKNIPCFFFRQIAFWYSNIACLHQVLQHSLAIWATIQTYSGKSLISKLL